MKRYGLRDVKVAQWLAENSYGTAVDFGAAQLFQVAIVGVDAELPGDDVIIDTHRVATSVNVTVRGGDISMDVLALLTGETADSSGAQIDMVFGQSAYPYFAICGKVEGTGDGGDTHMFVPKCKLQGDLTIKFEYGNYLVPELTAKGVWEGDTNGYVRARQYAASTAISIPLA